MFLFQGESTDNFNWGVRRRPLSEGEEREPSLRQFEESLSEKTPSSKHTTRVKISHYKKNLTLQNFSSRNFVTQKNY